MDKSKQNVKRIEAAPVKNSPARNISGYVMAFVAGGVLAAWGTFLVMQAQNDSYAKITASQKPWTQPPVKAPDTPRAKPKTEQPEATPSKKPEFDPIAEAERINEINRQNMRRTAQPPMGMPTPGRPTGITPPAVPGRPGQPVSGQPMQPQMP